MPLAPCSTVRRVTSLALAAALAHAALAACALAQGDPVPQRFDAAETIRVEVRIVPFYAVDSSGQPVYDLRPDEVELRVGGIQAPIESFDPYALSFGRSAAPASPLAPALSRSVYFLFDTTFSSPTGFETDQRLAARMIAGWPAGDRLFLITHGSRAGLELRLGPLPPDAEGKKELQTAVEALHPEVRRVELQDDPTIDFSPPADSANPNSPAPGNQMAHVYNNIQGAMRGEYHSVARDFASSLGDFAAVLRQTPGPKLLVLFSQGLDDNLYFQGDSGFKVGSTRARLVDTRRAPPLVDRFREPLGRSPRRGRWRSSSTPTAIPRSTATPCCATWRRRPAASTSRGATRATSRTASPARPRPTTRRASVRRGTCSPRRPPRAPKSPSPSSGRGCAPGLRRWCRRGRPTAP